MNRRILAMVLAVMTALSLFAAPASAASSLEEAMAEVNVYGKKTPLKWLTMNGSVKTQYYTYYNYRSEVTGDVVQIPAYCVDPNLYGVPLLSPDEGTPIKYSATSKGTDPKAIGIVANGYPHIDMGTMGVSSIEEAYYATKTALWCYIIPGWDISKLGVNPALTGEDRAAAERVLQATKDTYTRGMRWNKLVEPKLTATPDRDEAYPVTINGEPCYQQVFKVTSETWSYEPVLIELAEGAPEGTKILDMDNNPVSALRSEEADFGNDGYSWSVKVVYPKDAIGDRSGTCRISMRSNVVQYEIYFAKTLEADKYGNIQEYLLDTDPHTRITGSAVSSYSGTAITEDGTGLRIRKLETGTEIPLDGAVFEITYPDGSNVDSLVTDGSGEIYITLDIVGNYTVTELAPPKYHLLPEVRTQQVTVVHNKVAEVTFYDDAYGAIRVEKYSNSGEPLRGVTIQIKHIATGKTWSAQTGPAGVAEFQKIPVGGYEVRETVGITGWQFDGEAFQTVTVTSGETSTVTFTNKELPGLRIVKFDRATLQTMPDVTFEIFKDGTSIGTKTTDAMGEIVLTNLDPATYLVKEVEGPYTHITDPTPQEVELKAGMGIVQLVFYNDKKAGMHLIKVDAADLSKPIPDAKFEIAAVDGSYGSEEFTTGPDGTIDLSLLNPGAYVVTEKSCPGYVIDDARRIIELRANETAEFVFTNSILPSLRLVKISSDGSALPGVSFRIAKIEDGTRYLDRKTDEHGEINVDGLAPGLYSVQETATLTDHILDLREYHVELFPGKTSTLVIENKRRPNLIVYKHDADSGEPIAETVFEVRTADGHSVDEIHTDAQGRAELCNLLPGVYEIAEKSVPADWLHDAPNQLVTLYADRDRTVYFENHRKPTLTVNKVSSVTGKPLEGAKFHITYASNDTDTGEINDLGAFFTDENGQIVLTRLRDGWYTVEELASVPGYQPPDGSAEQTLYVGGGKNAEMTFENVPLSAITVFKYDSVTGEAVSGALFEIRYLTDTSGTGGTVIAKRYTHENGSFTITGLVRGTYIVEELSSDSDHVIDSAPQTVFLSGEDQDVVQVFFGNTPMGGVLIVKKDALTGKPLADVEFTVTDSSGAVLGNANGRFTTDASGSILIDNLDPGMTVVAKETRAISGYILDDTPQTAQVKAGATVTLEFRNQPKGGLIIEKYDAATKERLANATFRITDASGTLLPDNEGLTSSNGLYTTNAEGQIVLSKVAPSTLVVTEMSAPEGYCLDPAPQTVVIGAGDTQTLRFYDEPMQTLVVQKYINGTTKGLAGVTFLLTDGAGAPIGGGSGEYVTDANGRITISGLTPGMTVVAREVKTVKGYVLNTQPQTIIIGKASGQTTVSGAMTTATVTGTVTATSVTGSRNELTFYDEPTGSLTIIKRDAVTRQALKGARFLVAFANGEYVPGNGGETSSNGMYTTDDKGMIVIKYLQPCTVVIREVEAPKGYLLDDTPITVEIAANDAQTIEVFNKPVGGVELLKVDAADKSKRLADATFEIRKMDQGVVTTLTTGKDGHATVNLDPGDYYAVETEAPEGYRLDDTPTYFTVASGKTATVTVKNKALCGIEIHKVDSVTGEGIYGVTFLLYDSKNNVVGQYTSDDRGCVRIEDIDAGTYRLREMEAPGYIVDTQLKTVLVESGEVTLVEWKNTPITGQIQITKKSADYNSANGLPAGALLEGAVFEIRDKAGNLVDTIQSDNRGLAVSKQLPLGRYTIREVKAPANYGVNENELTAYLEHAGQIVRFEVSNKSLITGVSINKTGPKEVVAGQTVRYQFSKIGNTSNVRLESFYWRDSLPAEVILESVTTGTYNFPGNYKIVYRVNGGEPKTLADNLSTSKNYTLVASATALGLAADQRVTEVMFVFGQAPASFAQVEAPSVVCKAASGIEGKTFVNTADVGGVYNGAWVQAVSRWVTSVYGKPQKLPRTGY